MALITAAIGVRFLLTPYLQGLYYLTIFPAVALSTFIGGGLPGLFALILGAAGAWFILIPAESLQQVQVVSDSVSLALYTVVAGLEVFLVALLISSAEHNALLANSNAQLAEQRQLLLRELQHRVKNHIQLASSMLSVHARLSNVEEVKRELFEARQRLNVIGSAYSNAYETGAEIDFAAHLRRLCETLEQGAGRRPLKLQVKATAEARWGPDLVVPLSLIVNELVLNTMQHGFGADQAGVIRVRLECSGSAARLTVSAGPNLPVDFDPTQVRSLGLSIVRQLVAQIHGTFAVDRSGHEPAFHIEFPAVGPSLKP